MDEKAINLEHSINYAKNRLVVNGVKEVISFEEKEVNLNLGASSMTVKGSGLNVAELNLKAGLLCIDGSVESIAYSHSIEKMGFVKRLFK